MVLVCEILTPDHFIAGSLRAEDIHLGIGDMLVMDDGRRFICVRGGDYRSAVVEPTDREPFVPPHERLGRSLRQWLLSLWRKGA